jgi:hypothetical protein
MINKYGGNIPETYGVPVEEIQKGIKSGVRKVNIDTDNRLAITAAIREAAAKDPSNFDPRHFMKPAIKYMKQVCRDRYEAFGTAGNASKIKQAGVEVFAAKYAAGELSQLPLHLDRDAALQGEARHRLPPGAAPEPTGGVNGGLGGHGKINRTGQQSQLGLGLTLSPHGAEHSVQLALVQHEARHQGVQGALARGQTIDVMGIQRKEAAPILQDESGLRHHHGRTKVKIQTLNHGDGIAGPVHDSRINGVAPQGLSRGGGGTGKVNPLPLILSPAFAEQTGEGNLRKSWVGHPAIAIAGRQLHGLHHQVIVISGAVAEGG